VRMRRTAVGTVRSRIDAADRAIMASLSAESSPVLDRFLPTLSRSADFFVLWIGIAAALAASKDERGRRAAVRGLADMVVASTARNVLAKGLVRRPRPAGEVRPARRPPDAGYHLVSVRARRCPRRLRHRRRAGNAGAGGTSRGARSGRRRSPGRERCALSVRHCRGMGVWCGRRDADAPVVAAAPVRARGPVPPRDTRGGRFTGSRVAQWPGRAGRSSGFSRWTSWAAHRTRGAWAPVPVQLSAYSSAQMAAISSLAPCR
jgi:hypothetical protein